LINFICFGLVNGQIYNVLKFGAEGDGQTDDSNVSYLFLSLKYMNF